MPTVENLPIDQQPRGIDDILYSTILVASGGAAVPITKFPKSEPNRGVQNLLYTLLLRIVNLVETITPKLLEENIQTDDYTLALSDAGVMVSMNKGTANTLTVPLNATVAFPIGTQIPVQQLGAGTTTITPAGGVTILSLGSLTDLAGQYATAALIKRATNTWLLVGALA